MIAQKIKMLIIRLQIKMILKMENNKPAQWILFKIYSKMIIKYLTGLEYSQILILQIFSQPTKGHNKLLKLSLQDLLALELRVFLRWMGRAFLIIPLKTLQIQYLQNKLQFRIMMIKVQEIVQNYNKLKS